jgi:cell division protein FtsL
MITKKTTVFFMLLVFAVGSWLFYVKYSVVSLEDRIRYARREIIKEKRTNHILRAEWKSLTLPDRIQRLANSHLRMQQLNAQQLREFDPSIFHSENGRKTKTKTKKLAQLVSKVIAQKNSRHETDIGAE